MPSISPEHAGRLTSTSTPAHTSSTSHSRSRLSNQKAQPVTIHAVEHLFRAANWEITAESVNFTERDSSTIDFPVTVPAKGEVTLPYTVHYTW